MGTWDVDPVAMTKTLFVPPPMGGSADGLAFAATGDTLYMALHGLDVVRAYTVPGGIAVWDSPSHGENYDGVAIGVGTLQGFIYANTNSGTIYEFGVPSGPHAGVDNQLASGGSRGDFIAVDPDALSGGAQPSLLLTQSDRILRLDPPGGGWFGPPTSSPLPVSGTTSVPQSPGEWVAGLTGIAPNPADGPTRIEFTLQRGTRVRLEVLDLQGRLVAKLADGPLAAGTQQVTWNGASGHGPALPGIYFARLEWEGHAIARRFALTR